MALNAVLLLTVAIAALIYYYFVKSFGLWAKRGVPFVKPSIPFGNLKLKHKKNIHGSERMQYIYHQLKGKDVIGGTYFFTNPTALVLDLDLLRHVFVKDFQYFTDRGMYVNERDDPLSANLFALEGHTWKSLRAQLSPTFTSGKMKMMHATLLMVCDQLRDHLRGLVPSDGHFEIEMKELLAQYTTDIIGNIAFGLDINSLKNPDSEFRNAGRDIFDETPFRLMTMIFMMAFPNASRKLRLTMNKKRIIKFFMKLLEDTVQYREQNDVRRNDFLSLLLQIKNKGKLEGEDVDLGKMSFNELAAQIFLFFVAGFETSSSTMSFAVYELALNTEIQERVRQEINAVTATTGGVLTYDAAMNLKYLDQVIDETLRKYPIVDGLFRKCNATYQVPNSKAVLYKGETIWIPVFAIHRDPEFYPEPERFDPDRFTKENVAARHPYAYMPFGEGPRNCIGMRFGKMQTRLGLATLVKNFYLTPSANTPIPMKFKPNGMLLCSDTGIYLNLAPVET